MKTVSGRELARLLEAKGWELRWISGSQHINTRAGDPARVSIPIHGNRPLKVGLQRHLLRIAGVDEGDL